MTVGAGSVSAPVRTGRGLARSPIRVFAAGCLGSLLAVQTIPPARAVAPEDTPTRVSRLLENGAHELAFALIDRLQRDPLNAPQEWVAWERLRLSLLQKREDWDGMLSRTASIPAELPLLSQQSLLTEAVELLLPSGRGDDMLDILRELLWRGGGDSKQMSHWRRLVIRSYLAADQVEDAVIAMQRYQDEYLPADKDWVYQLFPTPRGGNAPRPHLSPSDSIGGFLRSLRRGLVRPPDWRHRTVG